MVLIEPLENEMHKYRCPVCEHTAKSTTDIWHVHSNGHNGHAFKMVKVD